MRVLTVGGGSGGHVTPVVAVIDELKRQQVASGSQQLTVRFWCDHTFETQAREIMRTHHPDVMVNTLSAGKFRRYHGMSIVEHIFTPSILLPNILDLGRIFLGFIQAFVRLVLWRPDVVFTKGGYVCLPVGYAAWVLGIPLVIHDSDAHPGLTNRLLAPCARTIATGAPLRYYSYPSDKSRYVGIPISADFHPRSKAEALQQIALLGLDDTVPLIVVTGGGLGARRINSAVLQIVDKLTTISNVLLISGAGEYESSRDKYTKKNKRFRIEPFISSGMADIISCADVVVSRAGATALLELAAAHVAAILIPNAQLTGGHQLKNAQVYQDAAAAIVLGDDEIEKNPQLLFKTIEKLIKNSDLRHDYEQKMSKFAKPHAAKETAQLIMDALK